MKAALTVPERPAIVHLLAVLDLLLLLLVFFVLIANVARESGVVAVRPPASEYRLPNFGSKIVVTARGGAVPAVFVGMQRVELDDIEEALRTAVEESEAESVLLLTDRMLPVAVESRIMEAGLALNLNVLLGRSQGGQETEPEFPGPPPVPDPDE